MEQKHVCSTAVENAAKRAAVIWLAKADVPVEGSYQGWSSGIVGSGVSISTYTICCSSAARGRSAGKVLLAREWNRLGRKASFPLVMLM